MENDLIGGLFRAWPYPHTPGKTRSVPPLLQALLSSSYFELEVINDFPLARILQNQALFSFLVA